MPKNVPITPEIEATVVAAYPKHRHIVHVAKEVGLHPTTVSKIIKRHGLIPYPSKHPAPIDETFFNQIDTREKAYFFGWLMSDGSNSLKYYQISLRLKSTDIGVLNKLKEFIQFKGKISIYTENPTPGTVVRNPRPSERASLQFKNKPISNALDRLGCSGNKTRNLVFPPEEVVPKHLLSHFMRGYVEGDGSFNSYSNNRDYIFQLKGTKAFIEEATQVIEQHTAARCVVRPDNKSDWFFKMTKTGRHPVLAILDWLYYDCGDMFLERKYQTYQKMRSFYESLPDEPHIDPETHRWVRAKWAVGKSPIRAVSV